VKLENKREDFEELNVQVFPICIGPLEDMVKAKEKTKSMFQFVSDPSGLFSDKIGMVHVKGNPFDGSNIARIGKVLVNSQGAFLWSHFTENSRVRLSSSVLLKTIKSTIEKP
tara:strand:- start:470 stop:805 length:336 start_codon:yes stop_codon:yes gene_type:complete